MLESKRDKVREKKYFLKKGIIPILSDKENEEYFPVLTDLNESELDCYEEFLDKTLEYLIDDNGEEIARMVKSALENAYEHEIARDAISSKGEGVHALEG